MDDDGLDSELAARPLNAKRDLAAIGDQNLVEQLVGLGGQTRSAGMPSWVNAIPHASNRRISSKEKSSFRNDEQRLPELDRLPVLRDNRFDDSARIGFDLVHQLHCLDNAKHVA